MGAVTLRVIDGPDRGKVFGDLEWPVTIGREEGNSVELSDERVSRFHLKIFTESGKTVLADLGSTNGTQVNGEAIHLWVLRPGDLILIGKTYLLYGTKVEISRRLKEIRSSHNPKEGSVMGTIPEESDSLDTLDFKRLREQQSSLDVTSNVILEQEVFSDLKKIDLELLRSLFPPMLPGGLSTLQNAQLTELFIYISLRLRAITNGIESLESQDENVKALFESAVDRNGKKERIAALKAKDLGTESRIALTERKWQNLLDLYALLSDYLKKLEN